MVKEVVGKCEALVDELFPEIGMQIVFDDCDCDSRRFWIHFRVPGLDEVQVTKGELMTKGLKALRKCRALAKRELIKLDPDYKYVIERYDAPRDRNKRVDGRQTFAGYTSDSWVDTWEFWGG